MNGLDRMAATARKERHEVTIAEVRNGIIGFFEFATRMRQSKRYATDKATQEAYAAAVANCIAFVVEFAEPLATLPEAQFDWRDVVLRIAAAAATAASPAATGPRTGSVAAGHAETGEGYGKG